MNNTLEDITKTSIQLMLKEPFYGHLFSTILKKTSEEVDSIEIIIGQDNILYLKVNPKYWHEDLQGIDFDHTQNLKYGALKHQILHIVFKHFLKTKEFGNKTIFDIAADLTVNQYIHSSQLNFDAIRIESFPDFNLERNQSVDYYYNRLKEELDKINPNVNDENSVIDAAEKDSTNQNDKEIELNEAQEKLLNLISDQKNTWLKQHHFWNDLKKLSHTDSQMIENGVNELVVNSLQRVKDKNFANLPAAIKDYINFLEQSLKPSVNWKKALSLFCSSSRTTYIKNTISKPSKRYGSSPGIKIQRKHKLLVVIDSSGSVIEEEINEFFNEIHLIWKQGADILVIECDSEIHNQYIYQGHFPSYIIGKGGTDFNPPIKFANDIHKPDAIIYFTDGNAEAPKIKSRKPILWLISSRGIDEKDWTFLPGRKVKIKNNSAF
jgi:predicted metal-dependent peptidase